MTRNAISLLCGISLGSLAIAASACAQPGRTAVALQVSAADLGDALNQFAQQSGQQILFAPDLVRGKTANRLAGAYTPDQALNLLLTGSGLQYRKTASGAFVVQAAAQGAAPQRSSAAAPAAEEPRPPSTAQSEMATQGEDIVVIGTAGGGTRRQDASFALTSISEAAIEQAAPNSTADLFKVIPGVSSESSGGQNGANIFVRGYPSAGDAEFVTLQTQGVPFFPPPTLSFLENTQLIRVDETIQRIEAVRGGTGALFSSGQPGLTVNFVQREGGPDYEALAKLSMTDFGEVRGDGYVSGPLGPQTSFMVGGYYAQSDGIRDLQFTSEKGGQLTANVSHEFERGSILVFGRYLNDRGQWLLPIPVVQDGRKLSNFPGFDAGTGTFAGRDTRFAVLNDGTRADLADGRGADIVNIGANLDYELADGITLRDRVSWLSGSADTTGMVPGGSPPQSANAYAASLGGTLASLTYATGGQAVEAGGSQLVIPVGFWIVRKDIEAFVNDLALEWKRGNNTFTVGAFYTDYSSKDRWNLGNAQLLTAEPNARRLNMTIVNNGTTQQVTRDGFAGGSFFNVNARYSGRDIAFYAVDELQVTDALRLDAGIRYQHHKVDGRMENNTFGVDADNNPNTLYNNGTAVLNGTFSTIRYRRDAWSWTAGANYAFSDQLGAFARYSRGRSFPFFDNLRDGLTNIQTIDNYELGLKASTQLFNLYVTLFHNEFDGLTTTQILNGAPVAATGGASADGVEIEGALRPFEGFQLAFSGTYLDGKYENFFSNNGAIDNSGNQVQRQPKWQWRVTPSYEAPIGDTMLATLFATVSYVGNRYSDVENRQLLPRYYKLDAGVSLAIDERLTLQVTGDNLTDKLAITEGNPRIIGSQGTGTILARPILGRSFRFSAAYQF